MCRFFNYLLQTKLCWHILDSMSFVSGFLHHDNTNFLIRHLNLQLTQLGMDYVDTRFPSLIPGNQWIFQYHLEFNLEICIKKESCKLYHQYLIRNWYALADIEYSEHAKAKSFCNRCKHRWVYCWKGDRSMLSCTLKLPNYYCKNRGMFLISKLCQTCE